MANPPRLGDALGLGLAALPQPPASLSFRWDGEDKTRLLRDAGSGQLISKMCRTALLDNPRSPEMTFSGLNATNHHELPLSVDCAP